MQHPRLPVKDARMLARLCKQPVYASWQPCENGHMSTRETETGRCTDCMADLSKHIHFMWQGAKGRARKAGMPFAITEADIRAVWPQNHRCPVLGMELRWMRKERKKGIQDDSPSLDKSSQP
jgi:hypothetical protein